MTDINDIRKKVDACDYLNEQKGVIAHHRQVLMDRVDELETTDWVYAHDVAVTKLNTLQKRVQELKAITEKL